MNQIYALCLALLAQVGYAQKTRNSYVKASVEAYLKPRLHNPKSYQFVSLLPVGEVTIGKNLADAERSYTYKLELASSEIHTEEERSAAQAPVDALRLIRERLDGDTSKVAALRYYFRFRARNAFNAQVLHQYIVNVRPVSPYKVYDIGADWGHINLYPGGFPGDKAFYEKYPR